MRALYSAVLYTALILGANGTMAADLDRDLLTGDMRKLVPLEAPVAVPDTPFALAEGGEGTLKDYAGKYVLLNLWATWCAPCREEMPMLAALQEEFGGDRFQVVTIATGRDNPAKIDRFMDGIGVTALTRHRDINQGLARALKVFGLPSVLLIDPEGREIARITGPAKWDAPEARALIASLVK